MDRVQDQDGSTLENEPFEIKEVKELVEIDKALGESEGRSVEEGEGEKDVEHCGTVGPYKPFEIRSRAMVRNCISCAIGLFWLAGIVWGIECFMTTGNVAIFLLTHLLLDKHVSTMIGFYYKDIAAS